jgi:hypothetical protein
VVALATGGGVVGAFTPITGGQVDGRQVATLRGAQLLVRGEAGVHAGLDFRVVLQGLLHGLVEGVGLYRQGNGNDESQGEGHYVSESHAHEENILISEIAAAIRLPQSASKDRRMAAKKASKSVMNFTLNFFGGRIDIKVTSICQLFRMAIEWSIHWHIHHFHSL